MAAIIFDFDGTLADTFPVIVDVTYGLSPRTKRLPQQEIDKLRRLPLTTALLSLGIPWFHVPRLMLLTRRRLARHMQNALPFEGIADTLASLYAAGHQLFVLSSNYSENVRSFLAHYDLEKYFISVESVYYANAWTKTRALRRLMKARRLNPASCYHVGNEVLDMRAASRAGIRGVAVTWAGYDSKVLKATEPFAIIDKPSELLRLVASDSVI